ncbi:DUF4943 family protein [Catalinimonas sp. 4WD22]|uniref:DUF4943 family protein n=1 Tax=Catalinimonas locisalis TaxID=3133978 RepID=UPI0031019CF5
MKTFYSLLLLSCMCVFFSSCEEDESEQLKNEVEQYMADLQAGKLDNAIELPPFTLEAIPTLLQYSENKLVITRFPRNPISSSITPECTVGLYALWIVESIRLRYAQPDEPLVGRFPSLNPNLARSSTFVFNPEEREMAQDTAAAAYQAWWQRSQTLDYSSLMEIDPLQNSDFYWF